MSKSSSGEQNSGVNISGIVGSVGGDIVGRDKIVGQTSAAALHEALLPVIEKIRGVPPEKQHEAQSKLQALQHEAAKGKNADDGVLGKLLDGLVELVPEAASAVVGAFATPILTKFVLAKLKGE